MGKVHMLQLSSLDMPSRSVPPRPGLCREGKVPYCFGSNISLRKAEKPSRPRLFPISMTNQSRIISSSTNPFSASDDPFASRTPRQAPSVEVPIGWLAVGQSRSQLLQVEEADMLLGRFEREQRKAEVRTESGLGQNVPEGSNTCTRPPLKAATVALCGNSLQIMFGVCAPSQRSGLQALKEWTAGLGLPKGRLHGMDNEGRPLELVGSVYIKYNSQSGDAHISGYAGHYRGVLFTPVLADGAFRQYGYLPLNLFSVEENKDK